MNPKAKGYENYGGRGITICDEWLSDSRAFIDWCKNANPPAGYTLDRENNNGPYSPNNCRWVTHAEQNRNHRRNVWVLWQGERMVLQDFAKRSGLTPQTARYRIVVKKMTPEKAILGSK